MTGRARIAAASSCWSEWLRCRRGEELRIAIGGRAGFGFSNPIGGNCDWQAGCDLCERDAQPVVDACSLLWAAEGGLVLSDGVCLAGQDYCLGAGGGERAAGSLGIEGGF